MSIHILYQDIFTYTKMSLHKLKLYNVCAAPCKTFRMFFNPLATSLATTYQPAHAATCTQDLAPHRDATPCFGDTGSQASVVYIFSGLALFQL